MASKQEFAKLLAGKDREGLLQLSRKMSTDKFLRDGLDAFQSLTTEQKRAARRIGDIYEMDRLDGLLMLITEKSMPSQACFGPSLLGQRTSDYDLARTFLLKNLRPSGNPGNPKPTDPLDDFYPELTGDTVLERLLTMARAHAGISPTDDRQVNLVSCSGRFNYAEAKSLVQRKKGTTCAVFLRALLDAAGDDRIQRVKGAFSYYVSMPKALGCNDNGSGGPTGNGWMPGNKKTMLKRGDLYFIRDNAAGGSGHVGIVKSVSISDQSMQLATFDGGQGSPGIRFEVVNPRKFGYQPDPSGKEACPWVNIHPGAARRLQGIARILGSATPTEKKQTLL